ncbi:MAG: 4Fe-4S dicluster domain-containing protein [Phocaeicola sp.]
MAKIKGAIVVDTERCKGCNLCVVACPVQVIALAAKKVNKKGYTFAEPVLEDTCIGCSACAIVCPDGCISVYKVKEQ